MRTWFAKLGATNPHFCPGPSIYGPKRGIKKYLFKTHLKLKLNLRQDIHYWNHLDFYNFFLIFKSYFNNLKKWRPKFLALSQNCGRLPLTSSHLSVCPSIPLSIYPTACPHGTARLQLDGFSWNFNSWIFSRKFVDKIQVSLTFGA